MSFLDKENWTKTAREFNKYLLKQNLSPKSALYYAITIDKYLKRYENGEEYGYKNIKTFLNSLKDTQYAYKYHIRRYIQFLYAKKKISKEEATKLLKRIKNTRLRLKERKEMRTLTKQQYKMLLKGILKEKKYKLYLITLLIYDTGARISAILKLKKKSFYYDEAEKVWKVLLEEKGDKVITSYVSDKTMELVKQVLKSRKDDELIFFKGKTRLTTRNMEKERIKIMQELKKISRKYLKQDISFHYIRRLAGIELYHSSGKNIVLVQHYFRHASPSITARYLKAEAEGLKEAWEKRIKENL